MRSRPAFRWLLLLTLLLGQWLTLAHAFEHPALADEPLCTYCVSGVGHSPAGEPARLPTLPPASLIPLFPPAVAPQAHTLHSPRLSQGPPSVS